jgi:hypothetical protein
MKWATRLARNVASQISENVNGKSRDVLDGKSKLRLKVLTTWNSGKLRSGSKEEFAISLRASLDKINALTSSNGLRSYKDFQLLP